MFQRFASGFLGTAFVETRAFSDEEMTLPRLFTGLEIPRDVGFALSLKRGGLHGARWIDPENYHITLRFIGDVDHTIADEVSDGLDRLSQSEAFTIKLSHLGAFGGDKPRALYAGVENNAALARLQAAQERVLQRIGLEPEGRKFVPHVTLARLRGASAADLARFLAFSGHFPPLEFPVGRFVLFSSRDSVGGGPYLVEQAYPLAA
ncbi:MAG: thpR [Hyphomicrobiales bacterium]|nr:thpR [Hyphomicrobiales bacterium]